jgi:hypothetical protein
MTARVLKMARQGRRRIGAFAIAGAALLLAGCEPRRPPPPGLLFEGLPVSGSLAVARDAGFTRCVAFSGSMRSRRKGVMLAGEGPYEAAVDLKRGDGGGGFDQLILWHDWDQHAVYAVGDVLKRRGWRSCCTTMGRGAWGDQKVYTHPRSRVLIATDISYWIKRRLRVIPTWNGRRPRC